MTTSTESRALSPRDLAYDAIAGSWDQFISNYDTSRRLEVLIHEFLGASALQNKSCLDGGCGLGYFSLELRKFKPAKTVSVDIAPKLVARLASLDSGIQAQTADLLRLDETIQETFDVVVSSEVIEHTPDPKTAVKQLLKRVKPGGLLSISCPNRRWIWLLRIAETLGVRKKYLGYENWVSPPDLLAWIREEGFTLLRVEGIHTIPWQFLPKRVLRWLDRKARGVNFSVALNLAVLAKKPEGSTT